MDFPFSIVVNSEEETAAVAKKFAEKIKRGDVIALNGDLGTGKTFFVKAVCREFNIENVNSPTFAIVYEYEGEKKIYHFDFYRIKKITELYDLGIEDYLNDEEAVTFIEWAELMNEVLPHNHISIFINMIDENKREIKIIKNE